MRSRLIQTSLRTVLCLGLAVGTVVAEVEKDPPTAKSVTLEVRNRLHPKFMQTTTTELGVQEQIGDTDFFFEVTEFYPHFAMIDSSKRFVTLSQEPENPTFRIAVFDNDSLVDETWAFFTQLVPHFSPKSYLVFNVTEFEYRGVRFRKGQAPDTLESK